MFRQTCIVVALAFFAAPLWSQGDSTGAQPAASGSMETDDRMATPTPVSEEGYSLAFASETPRTNYLRTGVSFGPAYDDNIDPSTRVGISDVSYSVWPSISLDQSRARIRWDLTYRPGFTFYQHNSAHNEVDQNLMLGLEYRLSPYVTLSVQDSFQKTSNSLNQLYQNTGTSTSGVVQRPNTSIVPPITDVVSNFGNVEITYQYGPDSMIGAKGTISGLWYPNRSEVPGLFSSSAQAGEFFYTRRLAGRNYIGATYQVQNLEAHPSPLSTKTQSMLFFYTFKPQTNLSLSFFTGPEHSNTSGGGTVPLRNWSPAAGASIGWQGSYTSLAASYSHRTTEGGGLGVAVRSSSVDASARWQLARTFTVGLGANYSINSVVNSSPGDTGGHTVSGGLSLERMLGQNIRAQLGYTRLHQSYVNFFVLSNIPDRNYVWVSFSYQFQRALGR